MIWERIETKIQADNLMKKGNHDSPKGAAQKEEKFNIYEQDKAKLIKTYEQLNDMIKEIEKKPQSQRPCQEMLFEHIQEILKQLQEIYRKEEEEKG